jgi:lipopolysaccharide/colanic/teichoic acid biosynthesis glycosyltransferase
MKPLARPPIHPSLWNRLAAFESAGGRWRLILRFSLRRALRRCLIGGADFARRGLDIIVSATALLLLSPLLLFVAALVLLDGGPILFAQTRVGRFGREFKMLKFRSMRPDAEKLLAALLAANQHAEGVTFKIKHDPRITRVGRYLRRYSVDELPQFYNVLIGHMSLVGPRPPVPREVALYTLADRRRLAVKPGLTCLWQISGRSNIDFHGQVLLDVAYIEQQCLKEDIRILARTPKAVVFGPGAY